MRFRSSQLVWLVTLAALGGCAATKVKDPLTPTVVKIADPLSAQLEFWHGITARPVICNDDAFHGLLLFLTDKDTNADYAGRLAQLKARKLVPQNFNSAGDDAMTRGTMAYAVVQALHIRAG